MPFMKPYIVAVRGQAEKLKLINPIPGRLKKSKNWQGGVNFTPLLHLGHCSQSYISDSHAVFLLESQINSKSDTTNFNSRYLLEHLIFLEKLGKKLTEKCTKTRKKRFLKFSTFFTP